ncbi:hypothetical protein RB195_015244 [Necator americanus]|uniref:Reverse transcriptase domain-containing protein n=1 Tax=Necator americanus TaxID=51031 RepID=A0ABR1E3M9_NECAM
MEAALGTKMGPSQTEAIGGASKGFITLPAATLNRSASREAAHAIALPKRKRTRITICTYNACTLASEAAIEDLMMQARKIKYDVIGLTETRRRHPLNAVYETGEELFLGTCDSRGVGGVGVLVNTRTAKNIDSFEQLTTRIGRLRMTRCGPTPALTIFVAYAPTLSYEEEEVEAFYMDLEKFYREDHACCKVMIGDFTAKVGPRRTPEELHIGAHGLQWNDQGERLSDFIMTTKTIHGNSQFQKPSSLRWTWESPSGGYRNEIDHIIVNRRFCLKDVAVVPKFYTGSDHRLLRGRFSFTRRAEKAAMFRGRNPRTIINWDFFATRPQMFHRTLFFEFLVLAVSFSETNLKKAPECSKLEGFVMVGVDKYALNDSSIRDQLYTGILQYATQSIDIKIKYDIIGLTETRRRHPLNAVYETGEELFLGTCDSRGVGGVGVLVNTRTAKNIDSFEQLTTRIGRLRMTRCGPTPALTIFVAYAPTLSYEEEEVEAFYMDLEKFYREDHACCKVMIGDFTAKVGPRRTPEELHIGTHGLQWNDQGERLSDFIMTTKTIHGNSQFQKPSSLRWTWESPSGGYIVVNKREAVKEDLKERRAEVLAEAAEAGKSIRYARRDFASHKTRMTALRNPKGTAIASRRGMKKIIYDFYSDLFDSHVHLPLHHLREDGQVIPEVLPSEIRHAIMSVRNRTAPGPDRIRPEHLKSLPPVLNTLARLFKRYLSECKVPKQWKTNKSVLLYKKGDPHDIGNYCPICLLSVIYKLFTKVILNRIEKVLDEGQPCEQAGFRKGFSTIYHIHTVSKLIEVSREYKMPLILTFIDLKKSFDSVETEAIVKVLDKQGVPTQYIKVLRELYSNFMTGISPFYKNIIIDVKRGVRQGDTI